MQFTYCDSSNELKSGHIFVWFCFLLSNNSLYIYDQTKHYHIFFRCDIIRWILFKLCQCVVTTWNWNTTFNFGVASFIITKVSEYNMLYKYIYTLCTYKAYQLLNILPTAQTFLLFVQEAEATVAKCKSVDVDTAKQQRPLSKFRCNWHLIGCASKVCKKHVKKVAITHTLKVSKLV